MFIARIDGTITSTVKHEAIGAMRLLIAQRIEADGREVGEPIVIGDPIGVRHGALVMVTSDGDYVRRLVNNKRVPVRLVALGIIDAVDGEHLGKQISMRPGKTEAEAGAVPVSVGLRTGFGRLAAFASHAKPDATKGDA